MVYGDMTIDEVAEMFMEREGVVTAAMLRVAGFSNEDAERKIDELLAAPANESVEVEEVAFRPIKSG